MSEDKGKCEYCNSENGHWDSKNLWHCLDCDRETIYYSLTERAKQVLDYLLPLTSSKSEDRVGGN